MRRARLLRDLSLHRTVAATAEAAHLTGPAVSQQLAALEKEVGMQLLVKQGRTLQLTAAGSLLVKHAEVILGGIAAAEADLEALRGGRGGGHPDRGLSIRCSHVDAAGVASARTRR